MADEREPRRDTNQDRLRDAFWPEITDAASARRAALYGVWAAGLTLLFMLVRLAFDAFVLPAAGGIEGLLIEAVAFVACAAGIWFTNSRVAACGGLILFLVQKFLQLDAGVAPNFGTVLIWLGIAMLWLTAIRGTFRARDLAGDA